MSGSSVQLMLEKPYRGSRRLQGTLGEEGAIKFGEGGLEWLSPSSPSAWGA